jgi:hypothetical protein
VPIIMMEAPVTYGESQAMGAIKARPAPLRAFPRSKLNGD